MSSEELDSHVDLISEMPDAILHYILTFADTLSVVRTSILSRRWRYVWLSVQMNDIEDVKKGMKFLTDEHKRIHNEKLSLEERAEDKHSEFFNSAVRQMGLPFLILSALPREQIQSSHFALAACMVFVHLPFWCWTWLDLKDVEESLKVLQDRDSMSGAYSFFMTRVNKPLNKLVFPVNYQPCYVRSMWKHTLVLIIALVVFSLVAIM